MQLPAQPPPLHRIPVRTPRRSGTPLTNPTPPKSPHDPRDPQSRIRRRGTIYRAPLRSRAHGRSLVLFLFTGDGSRITSHESQVTSHQSPSFDSASPPT